GNLEKYLRVLFALFLFSFVLTPRGDPEKEKAPAALVFDGRLMKRRQRGRCCEFSSQKRRAP
ncbi:MAG: hypothetical protein R6V19_00235, partial [Armatimonadota bacterium]